MEKAQILGLVKRLEETDAEVDELFGKRYEDLGRSEKTVDILMLQAELVAHVSELAIDAGMELDVEKLRRKNREISDKRRSKKRVR